MKLPNFYDFEQLNRVKQRMGIPRDRYGSLNVEITPPRLSADVLDQLGKEGREVSYKELTFLPNGTIAFGNYRVLVYIRDHGDYATLPKFHFASCTTLKEMYSKKKIDKYVVATRMDGWFEMNITGVYPKKFTKHKLDVCKNCLQRLEYKGYSHQQMSYAEKLQIVSEFSIPEFFEKYPVSLIQVKPRYNSDNAPINEYTDDWDKISTQYRQSVGWKCENPNCGRVLSQTHLRQYLHTHHRNGKKYDNKPANLKALCIECHAEAPDHAHLKTNPQYKAFLALHV